VTATLFGRFRFLCSALLGLFSLLMLPALAAGQGVPPLNQFTSNSGITYQSSVSVTLGQQQAGGTNVLVIGWNDTSSTIASVTDTNGNTYFLAAGTANITAPDVSEAIYFAPNIKAGTNTVTVAFNAYVGAQDVRLIEYGVGSGTNNFVENTTNPFDTSVGATGANSPAGSGTMTTAYANDLLVLGGTISTGFTPNPIIPNCGTGCTMFLEIPPTSPFDDIVADAVVNATGTYQGMANTSGGGNYVMQMIALRVAGQATIVNPAPTAATVVPATSPEAGGVAIAITGTGFLPGANVTITDGTHTASAINCSVAATTINCTTPVFPTNTSATVVVTNPDLQATAPLGFAYTNSTPFTASAGDFSPITGPSNGGSRITITGSDFASGAKVTIGGTRADEVVVQNSTSIIATAPAGSSNQPQTIVVSNPSGANGSPGGYAYVPGAGINFVQGSSAQPTGTSQPSAPYNLAQTAGDLNVVVIGWADTSSTIQSVTDNAGNTYTLAVGPTQGTGLTQSIYYAGNIVSSTGNTVTVRFNSTPANPDLRIVEYSGADTTNPLDGAAGGSGTGSFADSGPVTPSSVGDMILGAATVGGAVTPALGKACADNSCLFATAIYTPYADNVIHAFPTVAGPFDATANQTPSTDPWVMQAVAFRQPAGVLPGFTIGATAPATVAAGSSTASTVTVTPSGGFTSAVVVTCTGLPTGAACGPLSLTPGASPASGTLSITTASTTPAGTSTVTITGTSGSTINTTTVSLTVTAVGSGNFTLTATPAAQTVSPGGSGASVITINPTGGFTASVTFACSVSPTPSRAPVCSVAPSTSATTAALSVSTTAATAAVQHSSSFFYAMMLPLAGMTLLGVSFGSRRKKVLGILLVFLMASGLLFLASCSSGSSSNSGGGGNPGTPAGAYTVTVTGTSGSLAAQTTTFTLTVN
jgi:hypothetical protein